MKIILPIAGKGTRVRPHSYSKTKTYIRVADTSAIEYVIKHMLTTKPEEIIIIHDKYTGNIHKEKLPKLFPKVNFKFEQQEEQLGPVHAYLMAKAHIKEGDDILIINCDCLFIKNLSCIQNLQEYDGILFVKEVEDYQHFGVVVHKDNIMLDNVEKPDKPVSKLAHIGCYYFKNGKETMDYFQEQIDKGQKAKGEFYMPVLYANMLRDNKKIYIEEVDDWLDVGQIKNILETNAKLLQGKVWKGKGVVIENSEFGENVAIHPNTKIINCKITNSIIGENTILEGLTIKDSVIGDNVVIKKEAQVYNIGDDSTIM
tara:strand:+ start:8499 stop:9440 length:942 start_codon:yes stop_codon:yes gene_type:complete